VLVDEIRVETRDGSTELSGRVTMHHLDTEDLRIWFRGPEQYSRGDLDASPFLPGLLLTAMWWKEDLAIDGPVSKRLLRNVNHAITEYRRVFPALPAIEVRAHKWKPPKASPRTACLFSRGVDSWYSVLRSLEHKRRGRPPLTHLLYVPSIDFMYGDDNRARSIAATQEAAAAVGCELVLLETNLRHFTERFQHWGKTFGGGLSSIALAASGFTHVLLAASVPLGEENRSGSSVTLDPLFSTERTEIVHHGAEARRVDKVRFVAEHRVLLPYLKVCFVADTATNCGECEKCLVTMVALHIAGALDGCSAFERPLEADVVAQMPDPGWQRFMFTELIDELGTSRMDAELRRALEHVVYRDPARPRGS